MTGTLIRAVAVALVGLALGFLPGAVSGAPQDSEEIPIEVKLWVKKFVNEDVIKSLRARVRRLVGDDEVGQVRGEITFYGSAMRVSALISMPTLRTREFSIGRRMALWVDGWGGRSEGPPERTQSGDYDWQVERLAHVKRIYDVEGTKVELVPTDAMSFAETHEVLRLVKKGRFNLERLPKEHRYTPDFSDVWMLKRTGPGRYELRTKYKDRGRGMVYRFTREGNELIMIETLGWVW